ncbi:MAG: Ribosomal RNA small subunit methyltransferase H [Parcubacteria group bacterium GW2011_GWA1_47_10]|nr:MAG: Ribosomal RNA small subunit methyltransferase H [Parcubacteria group bacterium GW2011_GWA1_47_10]KKU97657.1 MAG: Ribosomal RNA small subunit methyltransferase H [Parcubacteria group bacterium GW2011_GWB1_48_6]
MPSKHLPVLLKETIEGLNLGPKAVVVDCTFGGGGHSMEICKRFPNTKIIALDQDKSVFEKAQSKFKDLNCNITFVNANFRDLNKVVKDEVNAIIFDLGLSSDQLENSERGFSFIRREPLLMTMKENPSPEDLTAYDVVNTWEEKSLADIIYGYGEEKLSRKIAKAIVEAREKADIKTTFDLVAIIEGAVGRAYKKQKLHCATRTFQALRIAVNDELGALKAGLWAGFEKLKPGGRMAVISFHSLEDRIVKNFYKEKKAEGGAVLINKKPITPGEAEIKENPRSRSAKLRILEKQQKQ